MREEIKMADLKYIESTREFEVIGGAQDGLRLSPGTSLATYLMAPVEFETPKRMPADLTRLKVLTGGKSHSIDSLNYQTPNKTGETQ